MGRSQRHMLLEQNTTSAGEIHAQGEIAPTLVLQAMEGVARDDGDFTIEAPVGPDHGPLQGSTMSGAVPESLIPPEPPTDVAPVLEALDPASAAIQSGDVTVTITGSGFTETSVMVWNGLDDGCQYVSDTELTTVVKTDMAGAPSTCTLAVRNGDELSNELTFELTEATPEAAKAPAKASKKHKRRR